jgi:hypothetical protein
VQEYSTSKNHLIYRDKIIDDPNSALAVNE